MAGSGVRVGPTVNSFGRPVQPGMLPMNVAYQANQNLTNQSMLASNNMMPVYNNIHNPGNQIYPTQVMPGPPTNNKVVTTKTTNAKTEEKSDTVKATNAKTEEESALAKAINPTTEEDSAMAKATNANTEEKSAYETWFYKS
jgi:hypothetical protein